MIDEDLRYHKVKQLREMLKFEETQPPESQYGGHLDHWSGHGKPINIDAGALRLLIRYYNGEIRG